MVRAGFLLARNYPFEVAGYDVVCKTDAACKKKEFVFFSMPALTHGAWSRMRLALG